jgi:RNase P subunit RPR2
VTSRDFAHHLFVCDQCHHLIDRLHVKLTYDSNQVYETVFHCQECDGSGSDQAKSLEGLGKS